MGGRKIRRTLHSIDWGSRPRDRDFAVDCAWRARQPQFPGEVFDHTSIIKTVMNLFGINSDLGMREQAANSFESIWSLSAMRTDSDAISSMLGQSAPPLSLTAAGFPSRRPKCRITRQTRFHGSP